MRVRAVREVRKRVTRDPCPGCGSKDGRPTNEVCADCRDLITDGQKYRDHLLRVTKSGERIVYQFPERDYALVGYYGVGLPHEQQGALTTAVHEAVLAVSEPLDSNQDAHGYGQESKGSTAFRTFRGKHFSSKAPSDFFTVKNEHYEWRSYILAHPLVREVFNRLDHELRLSLHFAYWKGVNAGWSLLRHVGSGETTLADAEQRVAEERRSFQRLCEAIGRKVPKGGQAFDHDEDIEP